MWCDMAALDSLAWLAVWQIWLAYILKNVRNFTQVVVNLCLRTIMITNYLVLGAPKLAGIPQMILHAIPDVTLEPEGTP